MQFPELAVTLSQKAVAEQAYLLESPQRQLFNVPTIHALRQTPVPAVLSLQ